MNHKKERLKLDELEVVAAPCIMMYLYVLCVCVCVYY